MRGVRAFVSIQQLQTGKDGDESMCWHMQCTNVIGCEKMGLMVPTIDSELTIPC